MQTLQQIRDDMRSEIIREEFQRFFHRVEHMRGRQRMYFAQRNDTNLRMAKDAEKEVDQAMQVLLKKGYKPVKPEQQPQQQQIFK
jgi:hypothetical protein